MLKPGEVTLTAVERFKTLFLDICLFLLYPGEVALTAGERLKNTFSGYLVIFVETKLDIVFGQKQKGLVCKNRKLSFSPFWCSQHQFGHRSLSKTKGVVGMYE